MRILLGNPNTTLAVTETMALAARAVAAPGTEIVTATARFGAAIIGTRAEMAIAEHAAVDMMARAHPGCDAAIIGASIDSGLHGVREMLEIPVLGLTEAALHTACLLGGRFGVVIMGTRGASVVREMIRAYGLDTRFGGWRSVATDPAALLQNRQGVADAIAGAARMLVEQDLVDTVVLIGAVMAGMPALVQPHVPVPVIEGVTAAVVLAEGLVRLRLPKPTAGSYGRLPTRALVDVDPAIQALFRG